ncbi:MAG: hypothetical protein ACOYXT_09920 [Bacteroidota bacterium]
MKKLFAIFSLAGLTIFTACDNENSVNPPSELGKATITGTVYAELDETDIGGVLEKVPAGTKIVAVINTKDLVINPTNGNYAKKYYETTVDANGKYSIQVDAGNKELVVAVIPADFTFDVKTGASTTEKTNFYGSNADDNVTVYKNGTFILDLYY